MKLRFEFVPVDTLPRLAWCAHFRVGRDSVRVAHGPWVETSERFFVEGAWDASYSGETLGQAVTLAGSGAVLTPDGVLFCGPSHNMERLYAVRVGSELWFSNSMVFVLVASGQELDLAHPNYFFDMLRYYRAGLRVRKKSLRTAGGPGVHLYDGSNLLVGPDLLVTRRTKDFGPEPASFDAYEDYLVGTADRVVRNALDPGRRRPFPALTSVSRGYDSAAVSALAAQVGCTEAVTFKESNHRELGLSPDDGTEIARHLGLNLTHYDRFGATDPADLDPAEMFVNVFRTTESHNRTMSTQTAGTLWLSGRHGEQFWSLAPLDSHPWLEDPGSTSASGSNYSEARLRIGYFALPLPYTLGVYAPALNRISRSDEMRPWRVGGTYDRPIARRILESRGVPRDLFGQVKMGGGGQKASTRALSPTFEADFLSFYETRVPEPVRAGLVDTQLGDHPYYGSAKMSARERWWRAQPLFGALTDRMVRDRTHHRWRSRYLYTFHWGLDRTRKRYEWDAVHALRGR